MDDEKLILLVQANECLYNKNCVGYKLADKKKRVWRQIALEMEVPDEMVIKRWGCLRDRYAREKRQENHPSGSGFKLKSQWPLMQCMGFIDKFVVPRASRCSYNICEEFISLPPSPSSSQVVFSPLPSPELPACENNLLGTESAPASPDIRTQVINDNPGTSRRKRHERFDDDGFSEATAAFKKLCEARVEKINEKDPLQGFGQMIVATIGSMPPTKQIEAMQKVTELVMTMKLQD